MRYGGDSGDYEKYEKLLELTKEIAAKKTKKRTETEKEKDVGGRPEAYIDEQELLQLRKEGYSYRKIADLLGVSHMTVVRRLRKLQKQ